MDYLNAISRNESMMTRRRSIREAMLEIESKEHHHPLQPSIPFGNNNASLAVQTPTSLMALAALVPKRSSYYGMRIDLMSGRNI